VTPAASGNALKKPMGVARGEGACDRWSKLIPLRRALRAAVARIHRPKRVVPRLVIESTVTVALDVDNHGPPTVRVALESWPAVAWASLFLEERTRGGARGRRGMSGSTTAGRL
jgi:hypothetical protein